MTPPFRYRLRDREKDALLSEQAAVIERQAARIAELEALLAQPKKTSRNSHTPPSRDEKASGGAKKDGKRRKLRPSRAGSARPLSDAPDETVKRLATACPHCAADVSGRGSVAAIATSTSTSRRFVRTSPGSNSTAVDAGPAARGSAPPRRTA